jgi:hypothetical protein
LHVRVTERMGVRRAKAVIRARMCMVKMCSWWEAARV